MRRVWMVVLLVCAEPCFSAECIDVAPHIRERLLAVAQAAAELRSDRKIQVRSLSVSAQKCADRYELIFEEERGNSRFAWGVNTNMEFTEIVVHPPE